MATKTKKPRKKPTVSFSGFPDREEKALRSIIEFEDKPKSGRFNKSLTRQSEGRAIFGSSMTKKEASALRKARAKKKK